MKKLGIINADSGLSGGAAPPWESLSAEKREEMDLRMAAHAAQIDRMDQNIGRLLGSLENSGKLDNT